MKGLIISAAGGDYEVVDNIEKPSPGPGQILVKSLATAINPVDTMMQSYGLLVMEWPIVLGCDAGGQVEEVGQGVQKFKTGDYVLGCTRLGHKGYGTFQEYHLMDEKLTIKKPDGLSIEQACTMGVGTYTASLALLEGLQLHLPTSPAPIIDEWVIILGGAGSVGGYAIQLAKICGYKVLASASTKTSDLAFGSGADAVFDYREDEATQLKKIADVTNGRFRRIFDAVAQSADLPLKALTDLSTLNPKLFATVDDWTPMEKPAGIGLYRVELGLIGRGGADIALMPNINEALAAIVPKLQLHMERRAVRPQKVEIVGGSGLESVVAAIELQKAGKSGGAKVVARISA